MKKYYWLKLHRDFFKRHDSRIIESLENGKDYMLFYLKLLVEAIDHEGSLRFSDTIPYDEKMLAVITNTNVDIVRTGVKVLTELGLMQKMDDGTLFLSQVTDMVGSETDWAKKKRIYREQKELLTDETLSGQKRTLSDKSKSKSKSKIYNMAEPEKAPKSPRSVFKSPTLEEVKEYCRERKNSVNAEAFLAHYEANGWVQGRGKPIKNWKAAVITWENTTFGDKKPEAPKKEAKRCPNCGRDIIGPRCTWCHPTPICCNSRTEEKVNNRARCPECRQIYDWNGVSWEAV